MVRIHPDPPGIRESAAGGRGQCGGAVAQLGERLLCKQEAVGSIPSGSTRQGTGNGKTIGKLGAYLWFFGQKISVVL